MRAIFDNHPADKPGAGAVHRIRPDGAIEYWTIQGWRVGSGCGESGCLKRGSGYPVVSYESTWAEPVEMV